MAPEAIERHTRSGLEPSNGLSLEGKKKILCLLKKRENGFELSSSYPTLPLIRYFYSVITAFSSGINFLLGHSVVSIILNEAVRRICFVPLR